MEVKYRLFEGDLQASGLKIAVVCSRFNEFFVSKLLSGAADVFVRHGGKAEDLSVAWVPGAYEIPFMVKKFLASGQYDGVAALGVVIQGATPHAGYINAEVSKALAQLSLEFGKPGWLWSDNGGQHRAGDRAQRDEGRQQGCGCDAGGDRDGETGEEIR